MTLRKALALPVDKSSPQIRDFDAVGHLFGQSVDLMWRLGNGLLTAGVVRESLPRSPPLMLQNS